MTDYLEDPILKRFISKINICSDDECWLWLASRSKNGYGQFSLNDTMVKAHRVAYFLNHGELPLYNNEGEELIVCHSCDIKICCNPKHLFLGTFRNNTMDMLSKQRGKGQFSAKLSAKNIQLIREIKKDNIRPHKIGSVIHRLHQKSVAKMFKVSQGTIGRIWRHDKWLCKEGYYV